MGMVYIAIVDSKAIAFHEDKKVVKKYAKWYKESHSTSSVLLAKSTNTRGMPDDYELIDVGSIFIQERYENAYYAYWCGTDDIDRVLKQLERLLLMETSAKRQKLLCEGIVVLKKIRKQVAHYIPTISDLEEINQRLEEYHYHMSYN